MEKLLSLVSAYPADKKDHALLGAAGSSVCVSFLLIFLPVLWAVGITAVLLACAAFGKERYDAAHPENHTSDPYDALATLLGGIAVLLPVFLTEVL